jgi:hypothetical protein
LVSIILGWGVGTGTGLLAEEVESFAVSRVHKLGFLDFSSAGLAISWAELADGVIACGVVNCAGICKGSGFLVSAWGSGAGADGAGTVDGVRAALDGTGDLMSPHDLRQSVVEVLSAGFIPSVEV